MTVRAELYKKLNAQLGREFDLYAFEHPRWFKKNIPQGAMVVLKTDDPGFNEWARKIAEHNCRIGREKPPLALMVAET